MSGCSGDSNGDPFNGTGGISGTGGTAGMGGASGMGGTAASGGTGSGGTGAVAGAGGASGGCQVIECAGRVTLCGDCMDNDDDGLVDNDDPECLG
ncbi:MAG: hypothetical protein JRJ10_08630, partial [Deltaproteobacteria bacterium]|nr:hypothetical protein [Deltaproteobacteria bacterium]